MDIPGRKAARVQLSIDPDLLHRIDDFAESHYLTRSGLVSLACSEYINAHHVGEAMQELCKLLDRLVAEGGSAEDKQRLDDIQRLCDLLQPGSRR